MGSRSNKPFICCASPTKTSDYVFLAGYLEIPAVRVACRWTYFSTVYRLHVTSLCQFKDIPNAAHACCPFRYAMHAAAYGSTAAHIALTEQAMSQTLVEEKIS